MMCIITTSELRPHFRAVPNGKDFTLIKTSNRLYLGLESAVSKYDKCEWYG